jgi:hypothetical protein
VPYRGVTLPKDVVRRAANYANKKRRYARRQMRRLRSATRTAVMVRGEETPSDPESSGGDEEEEEEGEEGEIISSPYSPSPEELPRLATFSTDKRGSPLVCVR